MRTAHQLCMHAKHAHGLQVCGTCLKSGRFFGNELELRDGHGMAVRACSWVFLPFGCHDAGRGACENTARSG